MVSLSSHTNNNPLQRKYSVTPPKGERENIQKEEDMPGFLSRTLERIIYNLSEKYQRFISCEGPEF